VLLDIATRHASSDKAVRATFTLVNASVTAGGGWMTPTSTTIKSTKKCAKGGKKGQKHHPCRLTLVASSVNKEVEDSDEECVATSEHDFKRRTRPPKDHFKKVLKAACPHHMYLLKLGNSGDEPNKAHTKKRQVPKVYCTKIKQNVIAGRAPVKAMVTMMATGSLRQIPGAAAGVIGPLHAL
jgi:hypothetical protein